MTAQPEAVWAEVFPASPGRRRWRLLAGALVVAASAAGFVGFNTAAAGTTPVLVVARAVPAGQPVTAADLRVVEVRAAAGVEVVPQAGAGGVLGRPAAVPLVPGSLLSPGQIGPPALPPPGEVAIAVPVPLPPAGLAAGSRVRVLVTPAGGGAAAGAGTGGGVVLLTPAESATVAQVGQVDATGVRVVTLLLAAGVGEQVAAAAAAGRVSLVVEAVG
jgi:Flp pilus assembly protein CpaB